MAMTTEQPKKTKTTKERIATAQAAIAIYESKIAKGEAMTEEDATFYQQSIKLLQSKGLINSNKPSYKVHLSNASTIKPEPIRWLWTNYLAKGKFHILGGQAGTGKTTLAIGLAATVTTGGRFPNGEQCHNKGRVLIWSAEDDPKDTIIPRLIASGADLTKVDIINGRTNEAGELEAFDPAIDVPLLMNELESLKDVDLIIIDPIVSAVAGDMHKSNDVRRSLQPLVDLAYKLDCAILGITHFSKGTMGKNPTERVTGSIAFAALARIVLVAAKEQDGQTRVLAISKSNIGDDNGGIQYYLEQANITGGLVASRVLWGEVIHGNAQSILEELEQPEGDERENTEPADTLKMILSDGRMLLDDVKKVMRNNGFSDKQLRTAREKLGIQSFREGFGKEMKTFLELPQFCPNSSIMPIYIYGQNCDERAKLQQEKNLNNTSIDKNRDTKSKNRDTKKIKNETDLATNKTPKTIPLLADDEEVLYHE